MTTSIIEKARQAQPPAVDRGIYGPLMPVINELLGNGFNVRQAVEWCVAEKQIQAENKRSAYYAIVNRLGREARKSATTSKP